jgi:hypothetical protein
MICEIENILQIIPKIPKTMNIPMSHDNFTGKIFGGKYKIIFEISKGGMGRIFLCRTDVSA